MAINPAIAAKEVFTITPQSGINEAETTKTAQAASKPIEDFNSLDRGVL